MIYIKALLLCAGKGTRLRPFTFNRPKHLLPILNKPLLKHTIEGLKSIGIKEFVIVIGYLQKMIKEYFKDGSDFGISIEYITQEDPKGTAQAVGVAESFMGNDPFLMA